MSVLLLSESDIAQLAPSHAEILRIVEDTYELHVRGEVEVPPKIGVYPNGSGSFLHAMPAWAAGARALGVKWISFFPGNTSRGMPDSTGIVILNDPESGQPLAIMEGMWITYARTGACAAVAARALAARSPRRLGLVGCGGLARWSLRMIAAALPSVEAVYVASTRRETRDAFCKSMSREVNWRITPADEVREAVEGMDIVISSVPKLTVHPVLGRWWSEGAIFIPLDVTGAWDDELYARADLIACDGVENLAKAFVRYRPNLVLDRERIASLQEIVAGQTDGRRLPHHRVLAFVTGIASIDMALAYEIYRRAVGAGQGQHFDFTPKGG